MQLSRKRYVSAFLISCFAFCAYVAAPHINRCSSLLSENEQGQQAILTKRAQAIADVANPYYQSLGKEWEHCCKPTPPSLDAITFDTFNFENYGADGAWSPRTSLEHMQILEKSLEILLPIGTPKIDVERLLIVKGGAVFAQDNRSGEIVYEHKAGSFSLSRSCNLRWRVEIKYDVDQKLESLKVDSWGCVAQVF